MIEQQRLKRCFRIKDGFLFIKLVNFQLQIEYMNPKDQKKVYWVKFKKHLKENLVEYFTSSTHLYKYLTDFPHKIVNITQKRIEIVVTRATKHSLVTLQLQKKEDFDEYYLFKLKMLILKERINTQKMGCFKEDNKNIQLNQQFQTLLCEAKQKYHLNMIKLESYQSTLKEKEEQLQKLHEQIKLKNPQLLEDKQKNRLTIDID